MMFTTMLDEQEPTLTEPVYPNAVIGAWLGPVDRSVEATTARIEADRRSIAAEMQREGVFA